MKKIFVAVLCTILMCFSFIACGNDKVDGKISVYMPDGAPALAMAKIITENNQFDREVEYNVVPANEIQTSVASKKAGLSLLPVNIASKVAGDGENYKLISVNTHGNLYVVGMTDTSDINDLKGKKVAVVNLSNVPGLTFRTILDDKGIDYTLNSDGTPSANEISLVNQANVAQFLNGTFDYIVAPEPAVSTILSKRQNSKILFDLNTLYGGDYPQAVLLARTDVYKDTKFINAFLAELEKNNAWLKENNENKSLAESAMAALFETTSITANLITDDIVDRCNIKVTKGSNAKTLVNTYISKIIGLGADGVSVASEFSDKAFG